jgi:hypothetical protein
MRAINTVVRLRLASQPLRLRRRMMSFSAPIVAFPLLNWIKPIHSEACIFITAESAQLLKKDFLQAQRVPGLSGKTLQA